MIGDKVFYNDWKKIEDFFVDMGKISYYCSFPTFYSHHCCNYHSSWYNSDVLISLYRNKFISLIGKSERVIDILKHSNPESIEIMLFDKQDGVKEMKEFIFNNKEIINNLEKPIYKGVRNSYNKVNRLYPTLEVKAFTPRMHKDYNEFLDRWKGYNRERLRRALTIKRDYEIMQCRNKLDGIAVYDGDKMVGAQINYPHPCQDDMTINIFRKHDFEYKQLHDFILVEGARYNLNKGYDWANDCSATAHRLKKYKKKYLGNKGYLYDVYSKVLFTKVIPTLEGWL